MREEREPVTARAAEDLIAALDRELEEANELNRRHTEHVRTSRSHDRPIRSGGRQRSR